MYINYVKEQLKDWKVAVLTVVFTIARIIFGLAWIEGGSHKIAWLSDGKLNSAGLISKMVDNLGPVAKNDPIGINNWYGWVADTFFVNMMPGVTDAMVVILEFGLGIVFILGFKVFWAGLISFFMNLQFIAAGSFNNFGYLWTDVALMKFSKYAELIGVSGYFAAKKAQKLATGK